jgi:hypothetical protein
MPNKGGSINGLTKNLYFGSSKYKNDTLRYSIPYRYLPDITISHITKKDSGMMLSLKRTKLSGIWSLSG